MGMVAILVMGRCGFVQIFVPSAQGGPTRNLVTFGPLAFEEMFETAVL